MEKKKTGSIKMKRLSVKSQNEAAIHLWRKSKLVPIILTITLHFNH